MQRKVNQCKVTQRNKEKQYVLWIPLPIQVKSSRAKKRKAVQRNIAKKNCKEKKRKEKRSSIVHFITAGNASLYLRQKP